MKSIQFKKHFLLYSHFWVRDTQEKHFLKHSNCFTERWGKGGCTIWVPMKYLSSWRIQNNRHRKRLISTTPLLFLQGSPEKQKWHPPNFSLLKEILLYVMGLFDLENIQWNFKQLIPHCSASLLILATAHNHKENEHIFTAEAKNCGEKKEPHQENVRNTGCYSRITWPNNVFQICYLAKYLQHHQPKTFSPMTTAHESQCFQKAPFPSEQTKAAAAAIRQQKPTILVFLSLFSIDSPKHSAASQALQGLCSETKHLSTCEKPPELGSSPRACQPGAHSPLVSVPHSSHTHTLYMTCYRPGREQELLLRALFLTSLSFAMVLLSAGCFEMPQV